MYNLKKNYIFHILKSLKSPIFIYISFSMSQCVNKMYDSTKNDSFHISKRLKTPIFAYNNFSLSPTGMSSSTETLRLVVLSSSRKSKLATASRSFSPQRTQKSSLPMMQGRNEGGYRTTASRGRTADAREYSQPILLFPSL